MAVERFDPQSIPAVRERELLRTAPGTSIGLVVDSQAAFGAVSVLDVILDKGAAGVGPHCHARSSELFVVVSGQLEMLTGDKVSTLKGGDVVVVPPLMAHAFACDSAHDARLYTVIAPGVQRFDYFRLVDDIFHGRAERSLLEPAQAEYDVWFVDSPAWDEARGAAKGVALGG
ncbi:cupin domain-containing protein [Mycobacterium sp. HNNTM2301]|uniref:cupin domain-containing protein n=1 Tax=Mycobacterium hainanense TaxID=3289775 RepID=UPI0035A625F0